MADAGLKPLRISTVVDSWQRLRVPWLKPLRISTILEYSVSPEIRQG